MAPPPAGLLLCTVLAVVESLTLASARQPALAELPRENEPSQELTPDPSCALSGFWAINDHVVVRLWKVGYDLGLYGQAGRGQCRDGRGRAYGSWFASSNVTAEACRTVCDESRICVGFEVSGTGSCSVLYDAGGLPMQPPSSSLTSRRGGLNGQGAIVSTGAPWGQVCYRRPAEGWASQASVQGSGGQAAERRIWRATYYPRRGSWAHGEEGAKEAPVAVMQERPEDLNQCMPHSSSAGFVPLHREGSFASGISVWWGTSEMILWGGHRQAPQAPDWQSLNASIWDPSAVLSISPCPVAKDVRRLKGELLSVHHAVWGLRRCSLTEFVRLAPELAEISEQGWAEVVSYRWRYGYEIFARRALAEVGMEVSDEACFWELLDATWPSLRRLSLEALTQQLARSACTVVAKR